jgi:hypothetical protein
MSSWGTAIFDDDLTADLRDTYREHLIDGVSNDEATRLTLADYEELVGTDEEHLVWLAIAAAQRQVGRLQPAIRDRALQVIDDGVGRSCGQDRPSAGQGPAHVAVPAHRPAAPPSPDPPGVGRHHGPGGG